MDITSFVGRRGDVRFRSQFFSASCKDREDSGYIRHIHENVRDHGGRVHDVDRLRRLAAVLPLIVANGLCLLVSGFILGMKLTGSKEQALRETDAAV